MVGGALGGEIAAPDAGDVDGEVEPGDVRLLEQLVPGLGKEGGELIEDVWRCDLAGLGGVELDPHEAMGGGPGPGDAEIGGCCRGLAVVVGRNMMNRAAYPICLWGMRYQRASQLMAPSAATTMSSIMAGG